VKHQKKLFNLLTKLCLSLLFLWLVNSFLFNDFELRDSFKNISSQALKANLPYLCFLILLMPLNWFLESWKWRLSIQDQVKLPLAKAVQAIFMGVTLGIVTPARVGEYIGRTFAVENDHNSTGIFGTFICSLAQNLCNILIGLFGVSIYLQSFSLDLNQSLFFVINLIILVLALILYFKNDLLIRFLNSIGFLKKYLKSIVHREYDLSVLIFILLLSLCRYLIYLVQFICALKFFALDTSLLNYFSSVSSIFLIQSSMPLPAIFDVLARGEISVLVLKLVNFGIPSILLASALLWVINLFLPALIGLGMIYRSNLFRKISTAQEHD